MNRCIKQLLGGLAVLAALGATYVMNFGLYPRYFDIAWDEEVQLHDGRVVMVHVKRSFERLSSFSKWDAVHRDTEISFDTGTEMGRFTKKFQRYEVSLVEQKDNRWFIGVAPTTGTPPIKWVDFDAPFLVLETNGQLRKESLANFPAEFSRYNVMPATPDPRGISKFNGNVLTRAQKLKHWSQFPRGAGDDGQIRRRKSIAQEEKK